MMKRLELPDMPVWPAPVTAAAWPATRAEILARGVSYLGAFPTDRCALDARWLDEKACDGYRRLRVSFCAESDDRIFAYLLIPDAVQTPAPAMIAVHTSASAGKDSTVGVTGLTPGDPPDPLADYGLAAVRRGYLVLAPDMDTVGERAPAGLPWDSLPFYRRHPAWSQLGKRAWDLSRCVDFLETLPEVDKNRVACMGHCHGAYSTVMGAAFDERIRGVLLNSGIWSFRGSRWSRNWHDVRQIHANGPEVGVWSALPWRDEDARGGYHLPAVDYYELTCCLAPRPLWLSTPGADMSNDAYCYEVTRQWMSALNQVYFALGHPERFESWIFDGPHGWAPAAVTAALDFLERRLAAGDRAGACRPGGTAGLMTEVMAHSTPAMLPHTWMDVNASMGCLYAKQLFVRAYRSLPDGSYKRLTGNGLDINLWVSHTVKDGIEYVYVANLHWWDLEITLRFTTGAQVHDLSADRPVTLRDGAWTFALGPYQSQAFRLTGGGIRSGHSRIDADDRVRLGVCLDQEMCQAAAAVSEARARQTELRAWPAWGLVAVLEQRLNRVKALLASGDIAAAYIVVMGDEFPMLRESVVSDLLQAMPVLVLGPFGKPEDTDIGLAEVGPDFRGMETAFIGEFADAAGAQLKRGFRPDLDGTHAAPAGRNARWRLVLNTRSFGFAPHAHSEHPYWMVAYAYTEVYSPDTRDAVLRVGSDHALWVWVNDQRVIRHGGHGTCRGGQRPGSPDQDRATVKLTAGWNRVLVKAVQRGSAQCFLRFTDAACRCLDDLRYRAPDVT